MTLATLLRYSDSKKGKVWDKSYVIGHAYHTLGEKFGIGVMAVMSEAAIDEAVKMCDGFILPGSSINIDPSYWGEAPFDPPEIEHKFFENFLRRCEECKTK